MHLDPSREVKLHLESNLADLSVPLVEICANTLSDEGTCYPSDHALSRCLVHGLYVNVWDVKCTGFDTPTKPSLWTGMCMGTNGCDPKNVLTCHRWMTNVSDPELKPINLEKKDEDGNLPSVK